jgi:anti-sigma regulatory factor (Ser/Thr protein kinase)
MLTMAVASAHTRSNEVIAISASWTHEVELSSDPDSVALARTFVTDLLHGHGHAALVADIQLVVSELATNAIVHASTVYTVTIRSDDELVVLEVRDGSQIGPVLRAPAALDTTGRGIAIVMALSRDWGVNTYAGGGKTVWAEFPHPGLETA